MKTNITTLVLNLLVSENKIHRMALADYIFEILATHVGEFGEIEKVVRDQFVAQLQSCVENPTVESRYSVFTLAEFYRDNYIEYVPELMIAA